MKAAGDLLNSRMATIIFFNSLYMLKYFLSQM